MPSEIEKAAIALHDYLWQFLGYGADSPIYLSGNDAQVEKAIALLNELQAAIKASPYEHMEYKYTERH